MHFDIGLIVTLIILAVIGAIYVTRSRPVQVVNASPVISARCEQTPDEIELRNLARHWQLKYHALESSVKRLGYMVVVEGNKITLIPSSIKTGTNTEISHGIIKATL